MLRMLLQSMISAKAQSAADAVRRRAWIVFGVVHAGLILAVYGFAAASREGSLGSAYWILAAGIGTLYGGCLLGAAFVIVPLYSLVRKVRSLAYWRDLLLKEMPQILALLGTLIGAFRDLKGDRENTARPPGPPAGAP